MLREKKMLLFSQIFIRTINLKSKKKNEKMLGWAARYITCINISYCFHRENNINIYIYINNLIFILPKKKFYLCTYMYDTK